jgi:hypothetical protein
VRRRINLEGTTSQSAILALDSGKLVNSETGILHFRGGGYQNGISGEVENFGTMLVEGHSQIGFPYSNHGTVRVASSVRLEQWGSGNYRQLAGSTLVNGTFYSFYSQMELMGGTATGNGTIELPVVNISATVAPGESIGTLTIENNNYTQQSDGTVAIEIAASDEFDLLAITGNATLDGTLVVSLLEDFIPEAGSAFQILTATGGIAGSFSSVLLPTLPEDLFWGVLYGSNDVTLAVSNTGDHNHDGIINAADFVFWRDTDGAPAGYTTWQSHFGLEAGTGMGDSLQSSVPEPSAWVLTLAAAVAVTRIARRCLA